MPMVPKWSLCNPQLLSKVIFFPYIEMGVARRDGQVQEFEYFLAGPRKFVLPLSTKYLKIGRAARFADRLGYAPD